MMSVVDVLLLFFCWK